MIKSFKSIAKDDAKLIMAHMYVAFIALFVGATAGLVQTLERSGKFTLPAGIGYYQILTVHGVVLGLVLTTFFILGFMLSAQSKTTGGYNKTERIIDRKSTRLNSSHVAISYAVFCLKKKKKNKI